MKRREFSLSAASAVAASALTLPVANPAMAQARQFKEGKDFKRLDKPVAPDAPAGKVDVIEFFWYSCPHCNAFEPTLDAKDDEILAWVTQQGVDVAKFKEVYGSFSVANQVRRASQLQDSYGVEGVPSMGVAGKYYTDGTMAGSMQTVLQVVEYLAATARKA